MQVKKITPVLFVEEIEPCVKFWVDRFGFEKTVEVPDGNKLAFAMLRKISPPLTQDRVLAGDIARVAEAIRRGGE